VIILSKQSNTKELKEKNTILKFIKSKDKKKNEYISKSLLIKKYKNAKFFTNVENVSNNGLIKLRNGGYAVIFSVDAIDLSLSSNVQKNNFFNQLKYLYQLKELNLRIYKLDDKIDLVYIATPHSEHYANMKLCIENGKHVLCEKAFTANAAQRQCGFGICQCLPPLKALLIRA